MIYDMDKLIKYIDLKDCGHCPYCKYQDECHGTSCYGGEPIEPPCCYNTPDNYLDFDIISEEYHEQTKIVVDKINTEELVVPKTNLEIINDVVKNLQNSLSFDFKIDTNKLHNIDGADALCLYCDELINEEREEKDMNKVLKLYYDRKLEEIHKKYEEKVDNDFNNIDVVKQYKTLIENFEKEQEALFKTVENFDNDYLVPSYDSNLYKYSISELKVKDSLMATYEDDKANEIEKLKELVAEADAQLSLSDDLTYQLEVLSRYDIIDKKTNKIKV